MPKTTKTEHVPEAFQKVFDKITALTDDVCNKHLTQEYSDLARQLCRKRPSPLTYGTVNSWACGIVYALGHVNFLFDKANKPYMSAIDLCDAFGVAKSTGAAKAKIVRDALKMAQMNPNWYLPSKMGDNPMAWLISFNGVIVDARALPRDFQEEAHIKELIPYIPADKKYGKGLNVTERYRVISENKPL
ncbi:hypothetical protein MBAV_001354 [Candidatus Magnetobacterium bavaricum]|uniref:DUF6398 domain-containing protein n=1 Tax=Candidatus Magnetobacterium bavaricum TaxID=29290 RepID=A0A0F3H0L0_9BACT|nr:hypothetical protein MBAV_001354 [Candidatus Magnetobacterium bavaricum]